MPSLEFKGKSFVYTHHLSVPFRELVVDAKKSLPAKGEKPSLDDNLIIHGDNLHALKALLPVYAGKVDCIFIDPPYNTGNEGWCYNDNVRSPLMKEWLKKEANPVDKEDLERHDKWLCMMWPRLQLLRELLAEHGSIFVTIDDNEVHRLLAIMDEIFGQDNAVATFIWRKVDSPNDNKVAITPDHEFVLCFARNAAESKFARMLDDSLVEAYKGPDDKGRYFRDRLLKKNGKNSLRKDRPTMYYPIPGPDGMDVYPVHDNGEDACWAAGPKTVEKARGDKTLIWKKREKNGKEVWEPYIREFADENPARPYPTIWSDLHTMRQAKAMLRDIFDTSDLFATPKPVPLISRIIELAALSKDAIVLDSFAGSGTTAHAVLAANKKDGGDRKFILVETEDYADTLTAERVRRVIKGYAFEGTQREELHREPITWTKLKKTNELIEKVEGIEMMAGKRFDRIKATIDDGELVITGEKDVKQKTDGLGGSFTFATLGPEMSIEALLTDGLPAFDALAKYVFYTATGRTLADVPKQTGKTFGYIGETESHRVHLLYEPDKAWLRSNDAALTEQVVDAIVATNKSGKKTLVFAAAKFMGQRDLTKRGVDFCQLPYAIHRILGD